MTTKDITGDNAGQMTADASDTAWHLVKGATITATQYGFFEDVVFARNAYRIDGGIETTLLSGIGIQSYGDDVEVNIGRTGTISGGTGLDLRGDGAFVSNFGSIQTDAGYGIIVTGQVGAIRNQGLISASIGIFATSGDLVVNGSHGRIEADNIAIFFVAEAGDKTKAINHGLISASRFGHAYLGYVSDDSVINDGRMQGRIDMAGGNDFFDNRGGVLTKEVWGGAGDDTMIVDNSHDRLKEFAGEGFDTMKSTVSYALQANVERLQLIGCENIDATGNALGNDIKGNSGDNHLSGDGGSDILTGGKGADTFIFKTGFSHDRVTDFGLGADRIDLSGLSVVTDYADLIAHRVSTSGLDLIIHAGTDQLVLEHVSKADLHASDFIF